MREEVKKGRETEEWKEKEKEKSADGGKKGDTKKDAGELKNDRNSIEQRSRQRTK